MQQPERGSAVAGVDVLRASELRGGVSAGATSMILQSCWCMRFAIAVSAAALKVFQSTLPMSTVGDLILARQPFADVIVDLRMLHMAGKHSIKQDLLPAVNGCQLRTRR